MLTLEALIFYSTSLFIVMVVKLTETHSYSTENEPLNLFARNSQNGSATNMTGKKPIYTPSNKYSFLTSFASLKILPFSTPKYQNRNIIKKIDLIYAKPYGISLGYVIDISQNAQMHNLKRYRRRTRKEDRFHCKNCRNIAADGRGKSEFLYSNKKKRTSTKPVALKDSSNLEVVNQEKQAFSNLPESFKKIKDSAPGEFSNEQGERKGVKKQNYISGTKMLNGHKEIKRVNNTKNSRKITLKPKYGSHKLQKVNPIDDTKRHVLVADKNFAVMKGYPHTIKTFEPYKNGNVTQDYSNKSNIRKQKTTVQFKHQASNRHKKLVNSKLGKTIPVNRGKVNMTKNNHGEVKKGDSFVNGNGKSMRTHTDRKSKLNVNNHLENHHKTQYVKSAKSLTGRSNKKNESLSKNIILNQSRNELEGSKENDFHTVRSQSKHMPEIKNASRTKNILKKVKSKRKVGLHRNFNLKNNINSKENNTSFRRSRFLKGLGRNLRNANEGALHDIKDFILKHFPENKRKRTVQSHISKSEFSKPSKGILNEIKEFVLNNFPSDRTKRNSSHTLNSSKHGKYIPKERYFEKIHHAPNRRSSNSLNIPEALKSNTTAKTLEKGISHHSNFDENVTDNVTDSDNNRSKGEVTGFARRDVQSVSYSVSTSTSVSVSDSTINEQATVIGAEEISTDEFDSNTVSVENLTNIVNYDENSEGEIDYQDAEAINNQSTTIISSNKADELIDGEENISLKSSIIGSSSKNAFTPSNGRSFPKEVSGYKKLNNSKREMALRSPEKISDRLQISDNSSESSILNANPNLNPVTAGNSYISQLYEILSTYNTDTFRKSTAQKYNENVTSNLSSDILISSENIQLSSTVQTRHKVDTMPNNYHSSNPVSNSSESASTLTSFMDTSTMDYSVGKRSQVKNQVNHNSTASGSYLSTLLKSKKKSKVSREAKSDESRDYNDQLTSIPTSSFSSSNIKDNDYELELKNKTLSNSLESLEATEENNDEYQDLEAVHNENDKKISINSREDKQEEYNNKDIQYDDDAHSEMSDLPVNFEKTNHKKYMDPVKEDLKEDSNKEEYEYDDELSYTETPEPIEIADDKSFNSDYSTERILNKSNQEYENEDTSEPNNSEISEEGITGRKSFRFPEPEIRKISLQEDETEVKENATYRSDRDAKNNSADQLVLTSLVLTSASPRVHKKHKENSLKSSKRNEMLKNKSGDSNLDTVETSTVNEVNIHRSETEPYLGMESAEGYKNETEDDYTEDDYNESGSEYSNDEVNTERTKNNAVNPSNRKGEMNLKDNTISSEANEYEAALEDGEYDVPHVTYTASLQNTRIKPEITTIFDSKFSSEEPEPSIWPTEVNQNINDSEEEYDYETTNEKLEPLNNMGNSKTSKLKFNDNKSMLEDKKFTPMNNKEARKYISEGKDNKSPVSSHDESEKYLYSDTLLNDDEATDLLRMKKEQEDENGENEMNPVSISSSPAYADLEETTAPDRYLSDDVEGTILDSNEKEEGSEDKQPSKIDSTPTVYDDTEDESNPVSKNDKSKSDSEKADDMEKIFDSQNVDESEDFSLKKSVREESNTTSLDISKENAYIPEDELITSTDLSFVSSYGEQLKVMPSKYYSGDTENSYDVDGRLNGGEKDDLESELIVENSGHFPTEQEIRNKTKRGEDNSSSLQKLKKYLNALIWTKQKKIRKRHHDTADIRKIYRTRKILDFEPPTMSDVNANSSLLLNNWLFGTAALLISLVVLIGI